MAEYIILAFTNPVAGREEEYNCWYDEVAVSAYKTVPGLVHNGRYKLADGAKMFDFAMDSQWRYLSVYTFSTDNLSEFMEEGAAALARVKEYSFSDTIDKSCFFEPMYVKR